MQRCGHSAWLALLLLQGLSAACQPTLSEAVLRSHQPRPTRDLSEVVVEQSGPPPSWLRGGAGADGIVLTGEGEGVDLADAQSLAQAALTRRVGEALGAEASSSYRSSAFVRQGQPQVATTSQRAVRMRTGTARVRADATYWQRLKRAGSTRYRAYARRVVPRADLRRGAVVHAAGSPLRAKPAVHLNLTGPRARAIAQSLFFARQGAIQYRVLDPRLPSPAVARSAEPYLEVQGSLRSQAPLVYELRIRGGGATTVRARDWRELQTILPTALHRLLVPTRGPRP